MFVCHNNLTKYPRFDVTTFKVKNGLFCQIYVAFLENMDMTNWHNIITTKVRSF